MTAPDLGRRIVQLDGLRCLAFLSVFIHHAFDIRLLWFGVDLFFILSGFLITRILLSTAGKDDYFKNFYLRRFLRIFPAYYLLLLLVVVFMRGDWPNWQEDWLWFATYTTNFRDSFVRVGGSPLEPMWSLAIEEQFYLLWPLVIRLAWGSLKRLRAILIALVFLAPLFRLASVYLFESHWAAFSMLPCRMDLLAIGGLFAIQERLDYSSIRRLSDKGPLLFLLSALVFAVLAFTFPDFRTSSNAVVFNTAGYTLIALGMTGVFAYFLVDRDTLCFRVLKNPLLVSLGVISYMMYLSHSVLLTLVSKLELQPILYAAVSLFLVIAWSTLSWLLLEKRLIGIGKKTYQ